MKEVIRTKIIPDRQQFAKIDSQHILNYKAICIFASTGFFLGEDAYFNDETVLQPATEYSIDEKNIVMNSKKYWQWFYEPREISLKQATDEFAHILEKITDENLKGRKIILPLSGGLDSRTQAAAINSNSDVCCYSYKFENSFDETKYGKLICETGNFRFKEFIIHSGYLWNVISKLSDINKCYADFTHPRQMAVIDKISELGDIFYLGHWGDVLFDDMKVKDNISADEQTELVMKKVLKKSGKELAVNLWQHWGLSGSFEIYLEERISKLLNEIKIDNANSRIRAFKSTYWAPRWTSANMNVFSDFKPVYLPYYSDEMCKFICTIPENLLAGRKIQIEYIKMKNPALAEIPWQTYDPFNLYNFNEYDNKKNLPLRGYKKIKRLIKEKIFGRKTVTRNWEIQFCGKDNDEKLRHYIFEESFVKEFVHKDTVEYFYGMFKNNDQVYYSHSVSMLLTLSLFSGKYLRR